MKCDHWMGLTYMAGFLAGGAQLTNSLEPFTWEKMNWELGAVLAITAILNFCVILKWLFGDYHERSDRSSTNLR